MQRRPGTSHETIHSIVHAYAAPHCHAHRAHITSLPGSDDSLFDPQAASSEKDGGTDHAHFEPAFTAVFRSFDE